MIMVDQIIKWPSARPPFDKGSCHLTTDGDLEELHAFAARIGLRRAWFQAIQRRARRQYVAGTASKSVIG